MHEQGHIYENNDSKITLGLAVAFTTTI